MNTRSNRKRPSKRRKPSAAAIAKGKEIIASLTELVESVETGAQVDDTHGGYNAAMSEWKDHSDPLDKFGHFVMKNLRDRGIDFFDLLAKGNWKAPSLKALQRALKTFTPSQREIVREAIVKTLDTAIHDFLFALQEASDQRLGLQVLVDGRNVAQESDGLHGELFTEDGWMAKFSQFGEPDKSS